MRRFTATILALACIPLAQTTSAADDISHAYAQVKPALVKVWAFDATGIPTDSGTGFVVQSDASQSWIVTATHVVDGASAVKIDVSRQIYDLPASVVAKTVKRDDITLLLIHHGGLSPVQFAGANQNMAEGKFVATAGYFQNDEQIGSTGEAPKLIGPGTVGSLPENGNFIGINLGVEEGLSGAPVFDSATGDVVGVVDVKSAVGTGGYAVSAPLIVLGFLSQNRVSVTGVTTSLTVANVNPSPLLPRIAPTPAPAPTHVAVAYMQPSPRPLPLPIAVAQAIPAQPTQVALAPAPVRTPTLVPIQTPRPITVPQTTGAANPRDVDACFGRIPTKAALGFSACSNLIARSSPSAFLYGRRCNAAQRSGQDDLAIADCTKALQLDSSDAAVYQDRAVAYDHKKLWVLALADANEAVQLNPNFARAYASRGYTYENRGRLQDRALALADYNRAVSLDVNQSFYIETLTDMPFEHAAIPSMLEQTPAGGFTQLNPLSRTRNSLTGIWERSTCYGRTIELYNDYTSSIFFNLFTQTWRDQSEIDPAHWSKAGRYQLAPGETKVISFEPCVQANNPYIIDPARKQELRTLWMQDVRFGRDTGPLLFPSTDVYNQQGPSKAVR